ncbi:MAG: DNA polymerase III subunit epsilon [Rhodobacteraceae bacterium]|jgi:DNA polymerase-3 subunit epsilon|nr:DNA polymerase III subunit epsilon [Paracoccaceae bacterium]
MREIVLDTETTGLEPAEGHRIVEIGAVELLNHLPTGTTFHAYLNPERPMPPEAEAVHGLTDAFLADKPRFRDEAGRFLSFIGEARLVIHNAAFDLRFLNAELTASGHAEIGWARVVDTLALARQRFPGSPASLDALCRRFGVDNAGRALHGALLDSRLLAEVYLELIGGRQPGLVLDAAAGAAGRPGAGTRRGTRPRPLPPRLSEAEAAAHAALVAELGPAALWAAGD